MRVSIGTRGRGKADDVEEAKTYSKGGGGEFDREGDRWPVMEEVWATKVFQWFGLTCGGE